MGADDTRDVIALFRTMPTTELKRLREAHRLDDIAFLQKRPDAARPTFSETRVDFISRVLKERGVA